MKNAKKPIAVEAIAQATGADIQLLRMSAASPATPIEAKLGTDRILRYLAATGAVTETSADHYTANNVTANLTEKVIEAGLGH